MKSPGAKPAKSPGSARKSKPDSPKTGKSKTSSPKPPSAKVVALQEKVANLERELEDTRVSLEEQQTETEQNAGLLARIEHDHAQLIVALQQLRPPTSGEGVCQRIDALRTFIDSLNAVGSAANATLMLHLDAYAAMPQLADEAQETQ